MMPWPGMDGFMISTNVNDIALRAKGLKEGPVAPEEVELARDILRRRGEGIIDAIYIVGLCGDSGDSKLLEAYLQGDENNLYAEYALKALCRYLGLIDRYRALLSQWMQDKGDGFRRMAAIFLAKEYFRNFEDNELGQYLIDVLCDMEDGCRREVRSAFVEIFEMRGQVNDPFGLYFDDWDEETTMIVKVAAKAFGHQALTIKSGRAVN